MTLNESSGDPIIIDPDALHPVVETGSFNFSYSAQRCRSRPRSARRCVRRGNWTTPTRPSG
jgi:hypothetical protein